MTKGEALRDRTAAAIIDSAAKVLAARGAAASMEEIAGAAGVGRATVYRYFPNREQLAGAMAAASVQELAVRIEQADLPSVPFEEAVARLSRVIVATGSKYVYLSRDGVRHSEEQPGFDEKVLEPIRALFRRALADGALRADVPPDLLLDLFSGLTKGAIEAVGSGRRGIEEAAAAVTTLLLEGTLTHR
ncbi:TetR/AcrR family transcriptional regulator [Cryptosporangium phraense]|uniref:TetR family transcriptional regulator n=1 Tax=Cryptosporangium phraense TaxID=2593070 RepID=A0A545AXY1_9ACTN|nr:TetR/AcrR family transcriptional regulator [Cryptosporangium phraense]TQS46158.1 TetR family transcriptional regulator [Cryptosporangium phraense]